MSLLIVEIPARQRHPRRPDAGDSGAAMPADWSFVFSADGRTVTRSGLAAASLLPRAGSVVAVLDAADVAWHRVTLPRVGRARLRAALAGLLEDELLAEPEDAHFALGPAAGPSRWVAVTDRDWLAAQLATLEQSGVAADRVVPWASPVAEGEPAAGWFDIDPDAGDAQTPRLVLATTDGVCCLRASGSLPRQLWPPESPITFGAAPPAAAAAERWLGTAVNVEGRAERLLRAASGDTVNLRQFDLAPRHRGSRLVREGARRLMGREWRWLRWGLVALAAVQVVGLNLLAWRLESRLADRREDTVRLLKAAHPHVRAVLDAPLQMQRETDLLRASAGRAGAADFEVLLAAASAAWPDGIAPVQMLRFDAGRLALSAPGFGSAHIGPMRERLRAAGFDAELAEGRVQITRAGGGGR